MFRDKTFFAVLGVLGICSAAGASAAEVNLLTGGADALLKRLVSEGGNTPADLPLTVDAGRLHRAKAERVTESYVTDALA